MCWNFHGLLSNHKLDYSNAPPLSSDQLWSMTDVYVFPSAAGCSSKYISILVLLLISSRSTGRPHRCYCPLPVEGWLQALQALQVLRVLLGLPAPLGVQWALVLQVLRGPRGPGTPHPASAGPIAWGRRRV